MSDVTVIIPTHGRPVYLVESLASCAGQTKMPCEVIVVSDQADEQSEALCRRAASELKLSIRYVERLGVPGASASRNCGVEQAGSEFVALLDDDDVWLPQFLEESVAAMAESQGSSLAAAWLDEWIGDDDLREGGRLVIGLRPPEVISINPGLTGSNFVVRRDFYRAIGGFDEALPVKNDTDFFYRFLLAGGRYSVVPKPLVWQRKHGHGQLTSRDERRAAGTDLYYEKHRGSLRLCDRRTLRLYRYRILAECRSAPWERLYCQAVMAVNYPVAGYLRRLRVLILRPSFGPMLRFADHKRSTAR